MSPYFEKMLRLRTVSAALGGGKGVSPLVKWKAHVTNREHSFCTGCVYFLKKKHYKTLIPFLFLMQQECI